MEKKFTKYSAQLLFLLISLTFLMGGCGVHRATVDTAAVSTTPAEDVDSFPDDDDFDLEAEFEESIVTPPIDPLSGYNRMMTQINDRCYFWLLKPVAGGYRTITPEPARRAAGRFFRNLLMPVRFTNNLLQFKPQRAGIELARFGVNSTFGILGLFDPAADKLDLQAYPEDFGQTLGHYGIGAGFHVVLPLLGPSNLRDAVGRLPDYLLSPATYIGSDKIELAVSGFDLINYTSLHLGEYESLKKDAIDLYSFIRNGYEKRRLKLIEE